MNGGSGENSTEQRKCRIVPMRVKESSGKNNQEQNKSGVGSSHAKRICGGSNTEQNSLRVDIDPTTLKTLQDKVICIEKDSTESKMMVRTKAIVEQKNIDFQEEVESRSASPRNRDC